MSGRSNMPQIAELRDALEAINRERAELDRAEKDKAHCELRIDQGTQRLHKAEADMKRLMAEMDVHAPGNYGYEHRLIALLTGLAKHAEEYGRSNP